MENPTYVHNLKSMRDAVTLRNLIEQEQDANESDGTDQDVIAILDGYIKDLRYRLGLIELPYLDDLHRLSGLKDTVRAMDPILDKMAEIADGKPLPPAAVGLCKFFGEISLNLAWVIRAIETNHPELTEWFANERAAYATTRE
jgi:hypothetical protein